MGGRLICRKSLASTGSSASSGGKIIEPEVKNRLEKTAVQSAGGRSLPEEEWRVQMRSSGNEKNRYKARPSTGRGRPWGWLWLELKTKET